MTILNSVIVITSLIIFFVFIGVIVISCIRRWKLCCDKKIKRNFVESFVKGAVSVFIIIICALIYYHLCNA